MEKVYNLCRKIPKGKVSTYRGIAKALNSKAYRAVGNALNKNPYSPKVPCHRVIKTDGSLGGFAFGVKNKEKLLIQEKVTIIDGKINLSKFEHNF